MAVYDGDVYDYCESGTYYEEVFCHSGLDENDECLDACPTWYTSNDSDGVCWCGGDDVTAYYTAAVGETPASCDHEGLNTYLETFCNNADNGYGLGFW